MKNRVAVTGVGVVSSVGQSRDAFWTNITQGVSGISLVESFNTQEFKNHFGGEIKGFEPTKILSSSELRVYGRATQLTITAVQEALSDAGLEESRYEENNGFGVVMGTTFGEAQILEAAVQKYVDGSPIGPYFFLKQYNPDSLSVNVGKKFNCSGVNLVIPTACAAGNYALAYAYSLISMKKAKVVIAGGADPFSHVSFSGFSRLGVMAEKICQPFDKNRKGMLVGEGAGILILEDLEIARKRKAKIYAEIAGCGLSCDANHMTIPEVSGVMSVMEKAMKNAGISYKDINYISAHGTGTPINDKTESSAIRKLFYERSNSVPVSSIKSMLGHTMGAASAIEAVACVLAIKNEMIPPTINFETLDPDCDIDCVSNHSRKLKLKYVLNNSFAFGGNNACVVFAKYND